MQWNSNVTIFVVVALLFVSAMMVMTYAEEEEELTVEVRVYTEPVEVQSPFPVNHNLTRCEIDLTGFVPEMICKIMGFIPTDDEDKIWDSEKETWVTPEEIKAEFLKNKAIEQSLAKVEDLTYWEEQLVQLDDRTGSTNELTRAILDKMVGALCYQGTGRAAATQDYGSWDIPTEMYLNSENGKWTQRIALNFDIDSVDLRGLLGQIQKRAQWCVAQNILETQVLSAADLTFGYLDQFPAENHRDKAKGIAPWTQNRMMQEANRGTEPNPTIEELVCDGYYSNLHKQVLNCETEYDMNFPIPPGDGFIEDSAFYQNYLNFRNGDADAEKAMVDKIAKENLAEAQQRIRNHSD